MTEPHLTDPRMPAGGLPDQGRAQPRGGVAELRHAALALEVAAIAAGVSLVLMFASVEPLGTVNDYLNAVVGWLVLAMALVVRRAQGPGPLAGVAVAAAALAAALLTWGTYLVVSGTTGYYRAGLVSSLGLAATGAWLLLAHAASGGSGQLDGGPTRLGRLTGWFMVGGVLVVPSLVGGVDDMATAPWHAWLAEGCAWLGLYVLLPVWCGRLRRALGRGARIGA